MRPLLPMLLLAACAPPLVDQPWLIDAPRVVAVTVDPPESAPGSRVRLQAVVAGGAGTMRWAKCEEPRAFSQNESINPDCFDAVAAAPPGDSATEVTLSPDVCARFGPESPGAGVRPRDADASGGSYQPVGVQLDHAVTFAFVRLSCQPSGVSFAVAQAFARLARPNLNPDFTLRAAVGGQPVAFDALVAGAEVQLLADWSTSPEESFALIDPGTSELTRQVERYDVSWFVTGGVLSRARSSSGLGQWQLPAQAGQGMLWAVLRDSRGGVAAHAVSVAWQ